MNTCRSSVRWGLVCEPRVSRRRTCMFKQLNNLFQIFILIEISNFHPRSAMQSCVFNITRNIIRPCRRLTLNYSHWCPCWIWMTSFLSPSVQEHTLYRAGIELYSSPPVNSTLRNTEILNAKGNLHIKRTLVNTRGTTSNPLLLVLVFVCELIVKLFQFDAKSECIIKCIVNVGEYIFGYCWSLAICMWV